MRQVPLLGLALLARRRRILGLLAFAALFLGAALAAKLLTETRDGHVEFDQLFLVGGYPLVSALLLLGWLLGRFPLIATLVMLAGVVSHDRDAGYARLYYARPVSPLALYGARAAALAAVAFLICAVLMPTFDLIMLGTWAGPATFVLILAYVLVYGPLVLLLSVWLRGDAWVALLLAIAALVWSGLRTAGSVQLPPGLMDFFTLVLPPQGALFRIESAFGALEPIPWDAFGFAAAYGLVLLGLAAVSLARREV